MLEEKSEEMQDIKIAAVMTVPMVGWNPHWGCTTEALRPLNIPIRLAYGAYFHQSMQNLLEDCIADGLDWALCMDYDSLFTVRHLDSLIGRFGQNPHIDALAALQCRRGTEETPLFTCGVSEIEVTGEPIKANSAHFGLTLIRLESLKKIPKPWFFGKPDENGSYKTLRRTDADVMFWHVWTQHGNTVYVDPLVSIGHLQLLVAEFDENLKPKQTHISDWRARNRQLSEVGA